MYKNNLVSLPEKIKKRNRNYGVDLLRILSMIFIINIHILYHGGPLKSVQPFTIEFEIVIFFGIIFSSGVNIFGMISGFVGFYKHKYSNLFYLLITTFFYNIIIALIFKFYFPRVVIGDIKYFLYPLFISDYWYFNCYFLMYFFLPIINSGINRINKTEMKLFIINLFLIYSLVGQLRYYNKRLQSKDILSLKNGFSYSWLLILYLFGSYFGRFNFIVKKKSIFIFFFAFIFLFAFLRTKIILYNYKMNKIDFKMIIDYTSPSSVIISTCFISIFSSLKISNKFLIKLISFLSKLTFGIYLSHNHLLVRKYIISNYFLWLVKYQSFNLILLELIMSLIVFFFCSIIEYIRYLLFRILKIREFCILTENYLKIISDIFLL